MDNREQRARFAAAALTGLLTSFPAALDDARPNGGVVDAAWDYADAMMAERKARDDLAHENRGPPPAPRGTTL